MPRAASLGRRSAVRWRTAGEDADGKGDASHDLARVGHGAIGDRQPVGQQPGRRAPDPPGRAAPAPDQRHAERRRLDLRHDAGARRVGAAGDGRPRHTHQRIVRRQVRDLHAHAVLAGARGAQRPDAPGDRSRRRAPPPGSRTVTPSGRVRASCVLDRIGAAVAKAQHVLEVVAHQHRIGVLRSIRATAGGWSGRRRSPAPSPGGFSPASSRRLVASTLVPFATSPRIWTASCTVRLVPTAIVPSDHRTSLVAPHPVGNCPASDGVPHAKRPTGSVRRSWACTASTGPRFVAVSS